MSLNFRFNDPFFQSDSIRGLIPALIGCPEIKRNRCYKTNLAGSAGGITGRAMAICLSRLGSNPEMHFGIFCSELLSIYSYEALGFF